jgi:hypothetical protein
MAIIKHGLTELNVYGKNTINNPHSTTLVEIFKGRGLNVNIDNQCLQLQLNEDEIKQLIETLQKQIS